MQKYNLNPNIKCVKTIVALVSVKPLSSDNWSDTFDWKLKPLPNEMVF